MGSSDPANHTVDNALPDIFVRCEGTIFLFEPLTVAAKRWIAENVQTDAQWFGNALVVEWRFAGELAASGQRPWTIPKAQHFLRS
jgi:hypothetical protein